MGAYVAFSKKYAWIGFIDIDEMIVIQGRQKLPTILNKLQADVVVLSWRMMTDNGLTHYEDKPVFKRFIQQAKGNRYPNGTELVKPFVRGGIGGLVFERQPHCPTKPKMKVVNVKGEEVSQYPPIPPTYEVAWINHYHTKTAEEFVDKCRRGFPNGDKYTEDYRKKAIDYFIDDKKIIDYVTFEDIDQIYILHEVNRVTEGRLLKEAIEEKLRREKNEN